MPRCSEDGLAPSIVNGVCNKSFRVSKRFKACPHNQSSSSRIFAGIVMPVAGDLARFLIKLIWSLSLLMECQIWVLIRLFGMCRIGLRRLDSEIRRSFRAKAVRPKPMASGVKALFLKFR